MKEKSPHLDAFAMRLFHLRQQKDVTAREMSLALGLSHNYVSSIENRKSFPKMNAFFNICEYLGITPAEFFDYTNMDPGQTTELCREIKKLDGVGQAYFLGLARDLNNRPK